MQIHDIVALTVDTKATLFPTSQPILLRQGQIGTIVEESDNGTAFEVEFADSDGQAYAMLTVLANNLMVLHEQPILLAS
jgi:hypothetical protein